MSSQKECAEVLADDKFIFRAMSTIIHNGVNEDHTDCTPLGEVIATVESENGVETSEERGKKEKRPTCNRCSRPTRTCICEALPEQPLTLNKCRVLVLQHPHEARRKNRSVPLIELCLDDASLKVIVARRFGDHVDQEKRKLLFQKNVVLVYPSRDAVSIKEALKCIKQRKDSQVELPNNNDNSDHTETDQDENVVTLIFLDATWKYAKEMEFANVQHKQYPEGLIRVKIQPSDHSQESEEIRPASYQPRRFDIRTPPSDDHLSTAECIAWITSVVEEDPTLYDRLMKPLDLMVEKWHSFAANEGPSRKRRTFTDGDGCPNEERQSRKR